jgi:hypothetical protein
MRHRVTEAGQQVAALPPPAFVTAASALYDAGWVYGAPAGAAYQP